MKKRKRVTSKKRMRPPQYAFHRNSFYEMRRRIELAFPDKQDRMRYVDALIKDFE